MSWAYGITTVPQRQHDLLPRTLTSLQAAGFDRPHLFVDGAKDIGPYVKHGLDATLRSSPAGVAGNWTLALWELYVRTPRADRYAVFQDDLVAYRNLRQYLERCEYPPQGYWNLYTFPPDHPKFRQASPPEGRIGWYPSNQRGLGAVGLVFSRKAVTVLLGQPHFITRPQDKKRGHRAIDGGVVESMKQAGWKEWVHNPSLVQHTGKVSAQHNRSYPEAPTFRGETFDAMELLT